jgi:hypothetical protein
MEMLNKFGMTYYKPIPTPMVMNMKKPNETSSDLCDIDPHIYRHMIASLMHLVNIRPDICNAISVLSQFMSQPRKTHWIAAKHVLRYLRGTISYGLRYASSLDMRMHESGNADWAESGVDQQSNYDCFFALGSAMVSLCNRKQTFVALSTIEAKYISLCVEFHEGVSLFKIHADLFGHEMESTIIHFDN